MDRVNEATSALAGYLSRAGATSLPSDVEERTKIHFLDTLASIISGSAMPAGHKSRGWAQTAFGGAHGDATIIGTSLRTAPFVAAVCNGMSAHADETDDSHAASLTHPGCSVLPATLAIGESTRCSGVTALRAFAAGYDVGCRVGRAARSSDRTGRDEGRWSSHSVIGTFGAAAAAAVCYGLNEDRCRYLFSYASQVASGTTTWVRDTHHVEKSFVFGGMPASHGVLAASLVYSGCDGVEDVFFGAPNWFESVQQSPEPLELASDLGKRFEVMGATIKKWAVGSPSQSAVDAMVTLIEEGLVADVVEEIEVHLDPKGANVVDNRSMPNVNAQYLLAGTLLDGRFSMRMSHDEDRMHDPQVQSLMARVRLVRDEAFANSRASNVRVLAKNGRIFERTVMDVRGTPGDPMTFDDVAKKSDDLIGDVLGTAVAKRINVLVYSLEEEDSLDELMTLCRKQA